MDQKFNKAFWDACANGDFATVCAEIKKVQTSTIKTVMAELH